MFEWDNMNAWEKIATIVLTPVLIVPALAVVIYEDINSDDQNGSSSLLDDSQTQPKASPKRSRRRAGATPADPTYDLAFLNTDLDWVGLLPRLGSKAKGSFCFYGLPGTGKSLLAKEIARRLGRPLMLRRGSDFLSRYVGETESRIADVFREARDSGAVLVIDEVDGMMMGRSDSSKSWELTQVNEMLCQMEDFDGLFICTTNDLAWLDAAALRRFSVKCRFDPLRPDQAVALFRRWQRGEALPTAVESRLRRLEHLTAGDFAAAVRRLSLFNDHWTAEQLCHQLEEECRLKPGGHRQPMGFAV